MGGVQTLIFLSQSGNDEVKVSSYRSALFMVTFWLCSHGTGQIFNWFQETLCV